MEIKLLTLLTSILLNTLLVPTFCVNRVVTNKRTENECPVSKWKEDERINLLKIFYNTNPGLKNHSSRIKEAWDRMYPDKKGLSPINLCNRARYWINRGVAGQLTDEERRGHGVQNQRKNIKWTDGLNTELWQIYSETSPNGRYQPKQVKKLWDMRHPELSHIHSSHLYRQVRNLCLKRGERYPIKNLRWTKKHDDDLMRIYFETEPWSYRHVQKMHQQWMRLYPNADQNPSVLSTRASVLMKKNPELHQRAWSLLERSRSLRHDLNDKDTRIINATKNQDQHIQYQSHGNGVNTTMNENYRPRDDNRQLNWESDQILNQKRTHNYLESSSWQNPLTEKCEESHCKMTLDRHSDIDLDLHLR